MKCVHCNTDNPEEAKFCHMDFERLGMDSMEEDGVRRTEFGLIRRLSSPFPAQEAGQTMA